jgi:probable O-glycosylation ligase (exosortase A-associated)
MKGLIFTYTLCYGGAVVSLFNPFVGLLIYICFAIIKPEAMWFWSVPEGNYSRVVAIALLLGWVKEGFGKWDFGKGGIVILSMVAFVLWAALSAVVAPHPEVTWPYVEILFKIGLPFLVGVTTIDSMKKLRLTAWVIVLSQGYIAYELNMTYLGGYNRMAEEGYGSLDNNGEAVAMNACIGMAIFLAMNEERWWMKALGFGMAGCMIHAVLLSFSRGGMLGLIVTGVVAFLLIRRRFVHYAFLAGIVACCFYFTGNEVRERFQTIFASGEERDVSAAGRLQLSAACIDLMKQNPFVGVGPDNFPLRAPEYGFDEGKQAHTTWLRIGAEMGLVGLLFYAMFHGLCSFRLWRLLRQPTDLPDPWLGHLAQAVIASFVGFAVSAQFVSVEKVEAPYYTTLVGVCVLKLLCQLGPQPGGAAAEATGSG